MARKDLVDSMVHKIRVDKLLKDKQIYIGIKGRFTFGAIMVPPDKVEIGGILTNKKIHDFYGNRKTQSTANEQNDERNDLGAQIQRTQNDERMSLQTVNVRRFSLPA